MLYFFSSFPTKKKLRETLRGCNNIFAINACHLKLGRLFFFVGRSISSNDDEKQRFRWCDTFSKKWYDCSFCCCAFGANEVCIWLTRQQHVWCSAKSKWIGRFHLKHRRHRVHHYFKPLNIYCENQKRREHNDDRPRERECEKRRLLGKVVNKNGISLEKERENE